MSKTVFANFSADERFAGDASEIAVSGDRIVLASGQTLQGSELSGFLDIIVKLFQKFDISTVLAILELILHPSPNPTPTPTPTPTPGPTPAPVFDWKQLIISILDLLVKDPTPPTPTPTPMPEPPRRLPMGAARPLVAEARPSKEAVMKAVREDPKLNMGAVSTSIWSVLLQLAITYGIPLLQQILDRIKK